MMEPKKYIKKYHFDGFDFEKELDRLLTEFSELHGWSNYIVTSPTIANLINSMYEPSEIEIGDTMMKDIQLRPRRGHEYLNLDFNITNTDNNYL